MNLDTKYFNIHRKSYNVNGKVEIDNLIVDYGDGESLYENRVYNHLVSSDSAILITKMKGNMLFTAVKIVANVDTKLFFDESSWFPADKYNDVVEGYEAILRKNFFDMESLNVIPGRLYNVYFSR